MENLWGMVSDPIKPLRWLAAIDPKFKGRLLTRFAGVGIERVRERFSIEMATDLGFLHGSGVRLPISCDPIYFFGHPLTSFGELATARLCYELAARCGTFVDVGAHLGLFVWYMRDLVERGLKIVYVEPNPQLHGLITKNLVNLGMEGVSGEMCAIATNDGEITLHLDLDDWTMSSTVAGYAATHRHDVLTVAASTFESLASRHQLNNAIVKVDIEGAEWDLVSTIALPNHAVRHIVLEVLEQGHRNQMVARTMDRLNFNAYLIRESELVPFSPAVDFSQFSDRNWLFTGASREWLGDVASNARLKLGVSS